MVAINFLIAINCSICAGADAFILATTSHEGGVEIEATNDPEELKKFSNKPRKKFSNLMRKELGNVATFPISKSNFNELRSLPQSNKIIPNLAQSDISVLNSNISSLRDEIRGMYITGSEGLGVELGESTFVKLQQAGFDTEVIKALSPAFSGLSIERGRIAFMKSLAASLTLEEPFRKFNRITFVNGFILSSIVYLKHNFIGQRITFDQAVQMNLSRFPEL